VSYIPGWKWRLHYCVCYANITPSALHHFNSSEPSRIQQDCLDAKKMMSEGCFTHHLVNLRDQTVFVLHHALIQPLSDTRANTGLLKMIVAVLTTCHTQYTWDSSICTFLFNRTTLQVFVTYLTGVLYMHPLWYYKHQHDNWVNSTCQQWWFQWRFWFVPSVPGYTRTLSLETVHTAFEWNHQMQVVSRIWCGIAAGQLYPDNHFE